MPATPSTPEPGDPRPLSERERRALSELEATVLGEDPALAARLRRPEPGRSAGISPRTYNTVIQLCTVFLVAVVILPRPWAAGLMVVAAMAIPSAIALIAIRRGER